jgi:hypothetical protein
MHNCGKCKRQILIRHPMITGYIEVAKGINKGDEENWINIMGENSQYCSEECFIATIKERFEARLDSSILKGLSLGKR